MLADVLADGFLLQPQARNERQHSQHRNRAVRRHEVEAGRQDACVAAELVDQEPLDQLQVVGLGQPHHIERAEERCEYPAAIDVPDDEHPRVEQVGGAHVHDVQAAQVRLGAAPAPSATIKS